MASSDDSKAQAGAGNGDRQATVSDVNTKRPSAIAPLTQIFMEQPTGNQQLVSARTNPGSRSVPGIANMPGAGTDGSAATGGPQDTGPAAGKRYIQDQAGLQGMEVKRRLQQDPNQPEPGALDPRTNRRTNRKNHFPEHMHYKKQIQEFSKVSPRHESSTHLSAGHHQYTSAVGVHHRTSLDFAAAALAHPKAEVAASHPEGWDDPGEQKYMVGGEVVKWGRPGKVFKDKGLDKARDGAAGDVHSARARDHRCSAHLSYHLHEERGEKTRVPPPTQRGDEAFQFQRVPASTARGQQSGQGQRSSNDVPSRSGGAGGAADSNNWVRNEPRFHDYTKAVPLGLQRGGAQSAKQLPRDDGGTAPARTTYHHAASSVGAGGGGAGTSGAGYYVPAPGGPKHDGHGAGGGLGFGELSVLPSTMPKGQAYMHSGLRLVQYGTRSPGQFSPHYKTKPVTALAPNT